MAQYNNPLQQYSNNIRMQMRNDTAIAWETKNPVLLAAEFGIESDTFRFKIGDGITPWNDLPYGSSGDSGGTSIPFIVGTQTAVTGSWTGDAPTVKELYDGLTIRYWLPYAGSGNATLNLTLKDGNNTGPVNCYYGGTSRITTHYGAGTPIILIYRVNISIAGSGSYTGWWADGNYADGNTVDRTRWENDTKVGATIYSYKMMMQSTDGKMYPLTVESGQSTTKTISTQEFMINSPILYYNSTTTVAAEGTTANLYSEINTDIRYTANQSSGWIVYNSVYIKAKIQSNGTIKLDNTSYTSFITQTLPSSEDGFIYILLGYMYGSNSMRLFQWHPIYEFKDGVIREYIPDHKHQIGDIVSLSTELSGKQPFITAGTTSQYWRGDKTWQTLNATAVGLGNVTNESKSTMFNNPTFTGTVTVPTAAAGTNNTQAASTAFVLNAIATGGLGDMLKSVFATNSKASSGYVDKAILADKLGTARTIAISGDATGSGSFNGESNLTIAIVLKNSGITAGTYRSVTVDAKGIVTAGTNPNTLSGYGITDAQPLIPAGTTSQYYRGDKTWATLSAATIGLGNVNDTSDLNKPISTATQSALNNKVDKVAGMGLSSNDYTTTEKTKLAGIQSGANKVLNHANNGSISVDGVEQVVYTHPTGAGNNHIPSGGAANQILRYSAAGTAVWSAENNTTYTAGNGLSLSGTAFTVAGGNGLVQETNGLALGTPSTLTAATTNAVTTTSHTHNIDVTSSGAASKIVSTDTGGNITAADTFKLGSAASIQYNATTKSIDCIFN